MKIIGIDPSTPYMERQAAFSDLVRRVNAEAGDDDRVLHHGGHRLRVSDDLADRLGLDGKTVNAQARPVTESATPGPVAEAAAAQAEAERGIAPNKPAKSSPRKTTARKTAAKKAAKRSTAKKATARKTTAKKTSARTRK